MVMQHTLSLPPPPHTLTSTASRRVPEPKSLKHAFRQESCSKPSKSVRQCIPQTAKNDSRGAKHTLSGGVSQPPRAWTPCNPRLKQHKGRSGNSCWGHCPQRNRNSFYIPKSQRRSSVSKKGETSAQYSPQDTSAQPRPKPDGECLSSVQGLFEELSRAEGVGLRVGERV